MKFLDKTRYCSFDPATVPDVPAYAKTILYNGVLGRDQPEGPFVQQICWVLDYQLDGEIMTRVASEKSPWRFRRRGEAYLYAPGTLYWERIPPQTPQIRSGFVLIRGGDRLNFERYTANCYHFCCFTDASGVLKNLLSEWSLAVSQRGEKAFWISQSYLYKLADLLENGYSVAEEPWVRREVDFSTSRSARDMAFVQEVKNFLAANYQHKLSLPEIARGVGVSQSSLSHRFVALTGETPLEALQNIRIGAVKLLLMKHYGLKKIAGQVGFCDEFYLSKSFKKSTGLSPGEFRSSVETPPAPHR